MSIDPDRILFIKENVRDVSLIEDIRQIELNLSDRLRYSNQTIREVILLDNDRKLEIK